MITTMITTLQWHYVLSVLSEKTNDLHINESNVHYFVFQGLNFGYIQQQCQERNAEHR